MDEERRERLKEGFRKAISSSQRRRLAAGFKGDPELAKWVEKEMELNTSRSTENKREPKTSMSTENEFVKVVQWILTRRVIKVRADSFEQALDRTRDGGGLEADFRRYERLLQAHPMDAPVTETPLLARAMEALQDIQGKL